MKKKITRLFSSTFLIVVLCCFSESCFAQLGDPGDDPDAPIDGGLTILVAAGVGYGIKKVRDERKKKSKNIQ